MFRLRSVNNTNFASPASEILEVSVASDLDLDVFGIFPERRVGGVRMEACEAAGPDLRHLDTAHHCYHL